MLGSVPSRSASSSAIASRPSGVSGICRYHDFCIQSARYSGRKFSDQQTAACRRARRPCARGTRALAASSQCRSSISVTVGCASLTLWITWRITRDELALARLRIEPRRRALRIGDAEEVEEQRQRIGEAVVEQHHAPGDLLARAAIVVLERDAEVGAEQLEDGQERNVAPVGDGAALVDAHAAGAAALEELEAQAALPGARLGHDAHHLAVARGRLLERVLERAQIRRRARRSARDRGRARGRSACAPRRGRRARWTRTGVADALHAELAEILEREVAADQRGRRCRQVAGVGRGERFHALREPHGVALRRVVHAQVVADRVPTTTSPELMPMRVEKPTPCSRFTSVA